jgi:hypothetical protein
MYNYYVPFVKTFPFGGFYKVHHVEIAPASFQYHQERCNIAICLMVQIYLIAVMPIILQGSDSRAAARGADLCEAPRHYCNNCIYSARKLRFPQPKEFLEKLSLIWALANKNFGSPVLGRKNLKNIGFKWDRILKLLGAPKCLGPALRTTCIRS